MLCLKRKRKEMNFVCDNMINRQLNPLSQITFIREDLLVLRRGKCYFSGKNLVSTSLSVCGFRIIFVAHENGLLNSVPYYFCELFNDISRRLTKF